MGAGEPSKLRFAKRAAAALAYVALVNNDRVVIETIAGEPEGRLGGVRGRSNVRRVIETLGAVSAAGAGSLPAACRSVALRHRLPGVAVLISDLLDKGGCQQAIRYLLGRRMEVFVIHVLAVEEIEPTVAGDLRLVDVEDGETVEVTVSRPLLDRYRATVAAFREEVGRFCAARGVPYRFADNRTDVPGLILTTLRRHGLLK
jgi:uncharacterized protein (DUF58 family)